MSTENGPYLRVDRVPQVREDFLEEYQVAVKEGLGGAVVSMARPGVVALAATVVVLAAIYDR